MKQTFNIEGMTCQHCVKNVENAVNELPGIDKVKINLKKNNGVVKFDEAQVTAAEIATKVTDAGYQTEVI
ncbi:copper chaperone CopZ [Enterococcus alishanensis]|uniref:Copper chaperone CopZ n=1 Tax=Enterococcus alishanensis TaxID=1303817 RepID=A0ABS6T8S9_9ENTE|nr:copper chaperone CopZ [Enterococcus alishanensis]MBV7389310.1 copper chaperone CopZ [Enterococcus alishanensis]